MKKEVTFISLCQDPLEFGLRYLSSVLKKNGYQTNKIFLKNRMIDDVSFHTIEQIAEIAKDSIFVGISVMADNVKLANNIANRLREVDTNLVLVGGGIHATIKPQEIGESFDLVVRGEAENIIVPLANKLYQNEFEVDLPGVVSKTNQNSALGIVDDIDELPYPDFTENYLLQKDTIVLENDYSKTFEDCYLILTSRGCPYACTFCANNFYRRNIGGKYFRKRSIQSIIEELQFAKNTHRITKVGFLSDNFFALNNEEFDEFVSLYDRHIRLPFTCLATPNLIDKEKIEKLVHLGLYSISIGMQSGSDNTLAFYKRKFYNSKKILDVGTMLNKFRLNLLTGYDLIVDNPYEKLEDLKDTISLMRKLPRPYNLALYSLTYYPGTQIYEEAIKDGLIKDSYYLENPKYYHRLQKSFYNSILVLYGLNVKQEIIDFLMKFESPVTFLEHCGKSIIKKSTDCLMALKLMKAIYQAIKNRSPGLAIHYLKLGFFVLKRNARGDNVKRNQSKLIKKKVLFR